MAWPQRAGLRKPAVFNAVHDSGQLQPQVILTCLEVWAVSVSSKLRESCSLTDKHAASDCHEWDVSDVADRRQASQLKVSDFA